MPTNQKYIQSVGRHKEAIAQVRLSPGAGKLNINNKEVVPASFDILEPLRLVGLSGDYDISVRLSGGGSIGQKKAARLGLARAIAKANKNLELTLKKGGFLTRDSRVRERKKYGLKSARKSPQWSKR